MNDGITSLITSGPLLPGILVAAAAGLISFLSPCILPLVPGYLAYITGLSGADLTAARSAPPPAGGGAVDGPAAVDGPPAVAVATRSRARVHRRVLAGGLLFIAGFGAVFITVSVLAATAGRVLSDHQRTLEIVGGALMIVFALALIGFVPLLQREVRLRWLPAGGLAGAPVFGAVFALSWVPCIGPTIGAVIALGAVGGETVRATILASAYTLGIGLPFLAFGLGFRWMLGLVAFVRQHAVWVTRIGAVLLILVGLALLSGAWEGFVFWLRTQFGVGSVSL